MEGEKGKKFRLFFFFLPLRTEPEVFMYIPLFSRALGRTGIWALDSHEMYDVAMTGVSPTCIVHLSFHFYPFFYLLLWLQTECGRYGTVMVFIYSGILGGNAGVCPDYTCISSLSSRGWYIYHSWGILTLG